MIHYIHQRLPKNPDKSTNFPKKPITIGNLVSENNFNKHLKKLPDLDIDRYEAAIKALDRHQLRILEEFIKQDNRYPDGSMVMGQELLGKKAGIVRSTANRKIKILAQLGLIKKAHRFNKTCDYKLPAIFRNPNARIVLSKYLEPLKYSPLEYIPQDYLDNIQRENIKLCGNRISVKLHSSTVSYSYINNYIYLSRDSYWYKESPSMGNMFSLKKDPKREKYFDLEQKYICLTGKPLEEHEWDQFSSMDISDLETGLEKFKERLSAANVSVSHPFQYLKGIIRLSKLDAMRPKTGAIMYRKKTDVDPMPYKRSSNPTPYPVFAKKVRPKTVIENGSEWDFGYPRKENSCVEGSVVEDRTYAVRSSWEDRFPYPFGDKNKSISSN